MKIILTSLVLFFLAFPVFAQSATAQRHRALSEAMGQSVTRSTATLADFDSRMRDDGTIRVFTTYIRRFESLTGALRDSEIRLDFLLRANAPSEGIQTERDNYERLLRELESVRTEYDNWLRTVQ